jgi:hypothetical protein
LLRNYFSRAPKEPPNTSDQAIGGFAFFLSLALLLPTAALFFVVGLRVLFEAPFIRVVVFLLSVGVGLGIAHYLIKGHISVLIHEWKHAIVSNLVGNRNKGMEVNRDSGSLQYEYTKRTAHYNAFIALAPYILPVFTLIGALISFAVAPGESVLSVVIVGTAYGIDLLLNARDVSPIQSDIYLIRGGYGFGVTYIIAWNLATAALATAWACGGISGLGALFEAVFSVFVGVYSAVTGWEPG